jgi:hypothetical protein
MDFIAPVITAARVKQGERVRQCTLDWVEKSFSFLPAVRDGHLHNFRAPRLLLLWE